MQDPETVKRLNFHLELVALLASCAEGENHYIESMCQGIIGLEQTLEVLCDPSIAATRKDAYLRYLQFVYLCATGPPIEVGTVLLHMETRLFEAMVDIFTRAILPHTHEEEHPHQDVHVFIMEAYAPAVTSLVKRFYKPDENPDSVAPLHKLGELLSESAPWLLKHFRHKADLDILGPLYLSLHNADPAAIDRAVIKALRRRLSKQNVNRAALLTDAEKAYVDKYHREIELNRMFNDFSVCLIYAYENTNTVRAQLTTHPDAYLIGRRYAEEKGEDEVID